MVRQYFTVQLYRYLYDPKSTRYMLVLIAGICVVAWFIAI